MPSPFGPVGRSSSSRLGLTASALLGAATQVMLFFVLSRVTGVVRDVVILAEFDLSAQLDAYQAAFRLPDMIFEVVAGGALGSAFLPTFTRLLQRQGEVQAWRLFSQSINAVTLLLMILATICIVVAPWLVRTVMVPGFTPDQQQLTVHLMRWLLLGTVVYGTSGLCMAALNTQQHFALPALVPSLRNLAIIGGSLFLTDFWGVYGLVAGAVAGSFLHLLVQLPAVVRRGMRYEFVLSWRDADLRHVATLMLPRMVGLAFLHLNFIVNTHLVSQLSAGSVSAMEYGFRLMLLPFGLVGQALAIAAFPTFAAQVEGRNWEALQDALGRSIRIVVFLALPATAGMYLLRIPLIEVLYERGSFTAESTAQVAYALQFFLTGLLAYAVVEVTVRVFYAFHDTRTPVAAGVLIALLNMGLSIWWVRPLGFGGPALANGVATTLEMVLLLFWLRRKLPHLRYRPLVTGLGQAGLATAGMAALLWYTQNWLAAAGWVQDFAFRPFLLLGAGIGLAIPVYFGLTWAVGFRDWWGLRRGAGRQPTPGLI